MLEFLDQALMAHALIKKKLIDTIEGTADHGIDPDTMRRDDACKVGEWIHHADNELKGTAELERLREVHAALHQSAYDAYRMKEAGRADEARRIVESGSFEAASSELKKIIIAMKRRCANEAAA
ncbi:MAG: CZB domain-containing protein [Rhodothalassiaceae bacterium]